MAVSEPRPTLLSACFYNQSSFRCGFRKPTNSSAAVQCGHSWASGLSSISNTSAIKNPFSCFLTLLSFCKRRESRTSRQLKIITLRHTKPAAQCQHHGILWVSSWVLSKQDALTQQETDTEQRDRMGRHMCNAKPGNTQTVTNPSPVFQRKGSL